MDKMVTTIIAISVHRKEDHPLFGDGAIKVKLEDKGGGMFFIIEDAEGSTIALSTSDVPKVISAMKILVSQDVIEDELKEELNSITISSPNS